MKPNKLFNTSKYTFLISFLFLLVCMFTITSVYASSVHVVTKEYVQQLRASLNPQILKTIEGEEFPIVDNPNQLNIIINKTVTLSSDYVPEDLVVPNVNHTAGSKKKMRKEAAEALENLFGAASQQGYSLLAGSGFRNYSTQQGLYNNYVAQYGKIAADSFSSKPGQSEHQLGLTMDYTSKRFGNYITGKIADTSEGKWVTHNAYRFGFIIRYPLGKEHITGYKFEPWHIRYVGIELATEIYFSGKTMEEYYLLIDDQ
jgi:D-alanyl-D-alanine carboxypeptidase